LVKEGDKANHGICYDETESVIGAPALLDRIVPVNSTPEDFDAARDLPEGFLEFLAPLHAALTLRQRALVARRDYALAEAHAGKLPDYLPPSVATTNSWRIELPMWCADQRNQMTGPADDADLVVKMLNSGAPGVMLDLEDSTANAWEHNARGIKNILEALAGRLTYFDRKRNKTVGSSELDGHSHAARGLHLHQAEFCRGITTGCTFRRCDGGLSGGLQRAEASSMHYIPKSESADERCGGATCSR